MQIAKNIKTIKSGLPEHVTLVAVTKTKPIDSILEAYGTGHRDFGENKVQEMVAKHEQLPEDINWHMIGHLQRNKVKYMAHFVHMIHGVDSLKLLREIDRQAQKHDRVINCLLQLKIAQEDSKFGMNMETARSICSSDEFMELKHIQIVGVMGMATFTDDLDVISSEFDYLKACFDDLASFFEPYSGFEVISMGMSADYELAVEKGSNMVRIGSHIFGARNY